MKTRWTSDEMTVLLERFETAYDINELIPLLPGRDYSTIRKKANAMGLRRPLRQDLTHAKLLAALGDAPKTVKEIAIILGYEDSSVSYLLGRAHEEDLCHICGHRKRQSRGAYAALWIKGAGENVPTEYALLEAERAERREAERNYVPAMDFLTSAMFGRAA